MYSDKGIIAITIPAPIAYPNPVIPVEITPEIGYSIIFGRSYTNGSKNAPTTERLCINSRLIVD